MRKPAQAMQTMQRLHEQGISVSLDDFGTGYSSMSYLQHLPLDILKIDRSFVADVETNPRNASICRALLSLGHSMGLTIIAEGVETPGQLDWLAAHGCDRCRAICWGGRRRWNGSSRRWTRWRPRPRSGEGAGDV